MEPDDRVRLQALLIERQMFRNYRSAQAAQSQYVTIDDLYIQVSRDSHETLLDLAIEALRNRINNTTT